jgi:membrane-associated protein
MYTVNLLRHLVENHQFWVYFFIFLGLIFEGEFVLISTGIFLFLGALSFPLAILVIMCGLLGKTFLGYYIGECIHLKWNHTKFLKRMEKHVLKVMPHFKKKPFWSIFVSKFIFGVNNIVIIFSGYQKIKFKKYLKAEFCSTLIWAPALLALGYFFSYTALHVSREIWRFSFIILLLVVAFFIFDKLVGWIYKLFEEFYDDADTE